MLSMTYGQLGRQILTTIGRVEGNTGEEILRNLTDGQVTACILTNVVEELIAARQQIGEYQRTLVRDLQDMRDVAKTLADNETILLENQRTLVRDLQDMRDVAKTLTDNETFFMENKWTSMQYPLKPRDEPQFAPDPVSDALATDSDDPIVMQMDQSMLSVRACKALLHATCLDPLLRRSELTLRRLYAEGNTGSVTRGEILDWKEGKHKGLRNGFYQWDKSDAPEAGRSRDSWHRQNEAERESVEAVPNPDDIMDTTMLTTRAKKTLRRLGITKRSQIDEDELMCVRNCGDKTTKELLDFRDGKLKGTSHGSDLCDELNEVGNAENTTRQEYLDWCKKRALAYVDAGEIPQALVSFLSDVSKHPETASINKTIADLGMATYMVGVLNTPTKMRNHIKGYT